MLNIWIYSAHIQTIRSAHLQAISPPARPFLMDQILAQCSVDVHGMLSLYIVSFGIYSLGYFMFFLFFSLSPSVTSSLICGFCCSSLARIVNKAADGGITALHMAALNSHTECVQLLLDLAGNVSAVTVQDGTTIDLIGTWILFRMLKRVLLVGDWGHSWKM